MRSLQRSLVILGLTLVGLVHVREVAGQDFASVAEWKARLDHTERLSKEKVSKPKIAVKIFRAFYYPFADGRQGVVDPFKDAPPKEQEEFFRSYVRYGLDALERPLDEKTKRDYADHSSWVGLHYLRQFKDEAWRSSVPGITNYWPLLLSTLLQTYEERRKLARDPAGELVWLDEVLSSYWLYVDCDAEDVAPRDPAIINKWKQMTEDYARLYAANPLPELHPPTPFQRQAKACDKAVGAQ
jgi:hypothetical protein